MQWRVTAVLPNAQKSNKGQTFHRFPKDLGLCRERIINFKRDPGRHFKVRFMSVTVSRSP